MKNNENFIFIYQNLCKHISEEPVFSIHGPSILEI